jgi:hypothetical protein
MSLNPKALALTMAIVWGGCLWLTGLVNLAFPWYGLAWLQLAASILSRLSRTGGPGLGHRCHLVRAGGWRGGRAIFGWLYNRVARHGGMRAS